ncbi:transcription initiation factor TFIID subunit 4-like [Equus przewalskii]|uniref:Transcription initiation factor TFIID subunit 4-like n=1 Tax=Equus przewalskii TaxID=9798 RepID=A0ABM4KD38_EQUPR
MAGAVGQGQAPLHLEERKSEAEEVTATISSPDPHIPNIRTTAPEREQRSILHPPPPPSSPPPTPPPPNAQRQAAAAAAATAAAAAEAEAVAARPAPCAAVQEKGEGRQAPPPKRRRPIDLKDLYRKNPHVQSKPEEWVHIHSLSFILLPRFLRNSSDQEFLFIFLMYINTQKWNCRLVWLLYF